MNGPDAIVGVVVFAGAFTVLGTLAKAIGQRIAHGGAGWKEVETLRDEVAQLSAEVEDLRSRVAPLDEIQNRLDFAERLLGQARERGLLNAPRER